MANTVINLSGVEREISRLSKKIDGVDTRVENVGAQVQDVKAELAQLRQDFVKMMEEQRRASALEQAATELVSVRQEMEKKFGNYAAVRNSMVGILQATDVALVRKTTISTVSEELMISTPDYWLAPVLVALAAWINNDRDLAERAIREAVKRDNEHTSLAMALICRRNHRTGTCYEWLARYFATQNAAKIDADSMVYIDAYINGIFGTDEKHLCDDYMANWISQIQNQTPEFEEKQSQSWAEYFERYNEDEGEKYPALKAMVKEFDYINKYLGKIDAVDAISSDFEGLRTSEIDSQTLAEQVDRHLMALVNSDDSKERNLRDQEEYLLAVKAFGGDVVKARETVNQRSQEKRRQTMSIVDQMTRSMRDQTGAVDSHRKKTAMRFLGSYINKGFNRYVSNDMPEFPQEVTLNYDGWTGKSATGDEAPALKNDYHSYLESEKSTELAKLDEKIAKDAQYLRIASIAFVLFGFLFCVAINPVLGFLIIAAAAYFFIQSKKSGEKREKGAKEIEEKYADRSSDGFDEIDLVLSQWKSAKEDAEKRKDLLKIDKVA